MQRPFIGVYEHGVGMFHMDVCGRFGGGYSGLFRREQVVAMLARDARRYDCGKEPIWIIAPADIKQEAGL